MFNTRDNRFAMAGAGAVLAIISFLVSDPVKSLITAAVGFCLSFVSLFMLWLESRRDE